MGSCCGFLLWVLAVGSCCGVWWGVLLWDPTLGFCCKVILLWGSTVESCCGALLWCPAVGLCCGLLLWDPDVGPCCWILLWDPAVESCCETLVRGPSWVLAVAICYGFLLWGLCRNPLSFKGKLREIWTVQVLKHISVVLITQLRMSLLEEKLRLKEESGPSHSLIPLLRSEYFYCTLPAIQLSPPLTSFRQSSVPLQRPFSLAGMSFSVKKKSSHLSTPPRVLHPLGSIPWDPQVVLASSSRVCTHASILFLSYYAQLFIGAHFSAESSLKSRVMSGWSWHAQHLAQCFLDKSQRWNNLLSPLCFSSQGSP